MNGRGRRRKNEGKMQLGAEKLTLTCRKAEEGEEELEVRGHGKDTRMWGPSPRA